MTFHSLDYVVFFVIVTAIYWRLSHHWQNRFLLVASYLFYGWFEPWFCLLLAGTTVVDWFAGLKMDPDPTVDDAAYARPDGRVRARRKWWLVLSLISNLSVLGFFKYFNFFVDSVRAGLEALGMHASLPVLQVVLPVGISFYTFQSLSYTIVVYRGRLRACRSLLDFALFVAFFPQLVAGPIERAEALVPRVLSSRVFNLVVARDALVLMAWGFFKKLVIADNVGVIANRVFSMKDPGFEMLWAGVFAFGVQIYADFSAYSDIARGIARWFGFELIVNFNHPYIAHSPADFWRRWHISLSTWFRDYVYIPLGGNRVPWPQREANVIATFVLSGFWHGASWNFVLWGLYHGLVLVMTRTLGGLLRLPERWPGPLALAQIALTLPLMMGGWLFFRETNPQFLFRFLTLSPFESTPQEREIALYLFVSALTWSLPLVVDDGLALWRERTPYWRPLRTWRPVPRMAAEALAVGGLFTLILVLRSHVALDFIYFQF